MTFIRRQDMEQMELSGKGTHRDGWAPKFPASQIVLAGLLMTMLLLLTLPVSAQAPQDDEPLAEPSQEVDADAENQLLAQRIRNVLELLPPLSDVEVTVREGVVLLSGSVPNAVQAERAVALVEQIPDVIAVDDSIERRLDVQGNLTPMLEQLLTDVDQWARALPLFALALLIFALVVYLGYRLARWSALWRRLTTNPFLMELMAQAVRALAILLGLVIALNLIGATALMATILGGAGVVGLAIGFAVRDTIENYISSIMLSLRQPFRAHDHVIINEHEGKVVRLTSRATVLMTLDGNQLRIPNATVFKGVILNYTRNPQRRFTFELGIDSADDPVAGMNAGLEALKSLSFVLADPAPAALIHTVGDSNIVLTFMGWLDQRQTDFGKGRSLAIRATMKVLEHEGFTLPEPIYRLRFDDAKKAQQVMAGRRAANTAADGPPPAEPSKKDTTASDTKVKSASAKSAEARTSSETATQAQPDAEKLMDVKPDTHLDAMVDEERALKDNSDLLDSTRPVE